MARAFVIRGFDKKKDSKGNEIDFELVQSALITPALEQCDLSGGTTAEVVEAGNIRADMFALILEADIVICDITIHNANVFYELGIRHALRKRHTIMIKGDPSADTTPFDLSTDRYLKYPVANPGAAVDSLVEAVKSSLRTNRETDSPIFLMLPKLAEADLTGMAMVPLDFIEEVQRAEAAKDKAWLRVIAEDLRGLRYERDGLRRVARAQWKLKDYAAAKVNWEGIRQTLRADVEANLALANLYEREYRVTEKAQLLTSSNQAISTVLQSEDGTPAQYAEAQALHARNMKTLWRAGFAKLDDPVQARQMAVDTQALESYRSYRKAFECDLNAFYPGLAALQMGYILMMLSSLPEWDNLFPGEPVQCERVREDLKRELPALTNVVKAAVDRAKARLPKNDRMWAEIAAADLLFLTLPDTALPASRAGIVQAYRNAIPKDDLFAWDSTCGQLGLFAQLGFRADIAQAVMALAPQKTESRSSLIVFAGHRVDRDGEPPRFPPASEPKARGLITERLKKICDECPKDEQVTLLASAAPGADVLAHEIAAELGLTSRLCLPMPPEAVARLVFTAADGWRARFLKVVDVHKDDVLQLSDNSELGRWLQGRPGIDPWERGNRWVMQLAETWGANRVTLLALWDGQDNGRTGGTAHMVDLARKSGRFTLEVIDSRLLLS